MKTLMILLGFICAAVLPSTAQTSGNSSLSDLPKVMPAAAQMRFVADGGMVQQFTRITVSGNNLLVEQLTPKDRSPKKRSAKISDEDANTLYRAFAANKFDFMEINANTRTVYDAPRQSVSISTGNTAYEVSSGAGSPLKGANLKSYENIKNAFDKLQVAYKNKMKRVK